MLLSKKWRIRRGAVRRGAHRHSAATFGARCAHGWHQAQVWRHRLLTFALALASLGGVYGGLQTLLDADRFPLRHIDVYGTLRHLPQVELAASTQALRGQNFFLADIGALQSTLAANPWLESVAVQRRWPDRVALIVSERQVFSRWRERELLDWQGRRFTPATLPAQALAWPVLAAPARHERIIMAAYQTAAGHARRLNLTISRLTQDERLAWQLEFSNGLKVLLGKDETGQRWLAERLRLFAIVYPTVLAPCQAHIAAVDMRYAQGFTVRWSDTTQALPAGLADGCQGTSIPALTADRTQPGREGNNGAKS